MGTPVFQRSERNHAMRPTPPGSPGSARAEPSMSDDAIYGALVAWNAALVHAAHAPREAVALEELFPRATRLARRDATVLRTLPLLFARHGEQLSLEHLKETAAREKQESEVGMLLALTGHLTGNERLLQAAELFAHARSPVPELFFLSAHSEREYRLAQLRTPSIVREWGFLMNMPEDVFRTVLEKYSA